jgi:hypothetical protein
MKPSKTHRSPRSRRHAANPDKPPPAAALNMGILADLLGFNVRRAQIELRRDFIANLGDDIVRPGIFSLLALVDANPGIAQVDLVNALGIDKASLVPLLNRLENVGW